MQTVLITGASGLIGTPLTLLLKTRGYKVIHLSRTLQNQKDVETFLWNVKTSTIDSAAIQQADYIIHLAGAGIADKRWTASRKKEIVESRSNSSQLLFDCLKQQNKKLKGFISASAVGYYGAVSSEKIFKETDKAATDFLGTTTSAWEAAVDPISALGIRTVKFRLGVVLSNKGSALPKLITPINYFIGSAIGTGKQYFPWVHCDDVCAAFLSAIENDKMEGVYNLVAPQHITNKELVETIATVLNKPLWMPSIPAFVIKLIFGELSSTLLNGSRVSSQKLMDTGFVFNYTSLTSAIEQLLNKQYIWR